MFDKWTVSERIIIKETANVTVTVSPGSTDVSTGDTVQVIEYTESGYDPVKPTVKTSSGSSVTVTNVSNDYNCGGWKDDGKSTDVRFSNVMKSGKSIIGFTVSYLHKAVGGSNSYYTSIQSKPFDSTSGSYGDFTDSGNIAKLGATTKNNVVSNHQNDIVQPYGIRAFSDSGYSNFSANTTLSYQFYCTESPLAKGIYYMYFWTTYNGKFYPDGLVCMIYVDANGDPHVCNEYSFTMPEGTVTLTPAAE